VGAAIGSPDPVLDLEQPDGTWIRVFAVPPSPGYDSEIVSLDPAAAAGVVLQEPDEASSTLDALGASAIRIWPANVPPAVVDALRQTGRPVVVAPE
jgi:hypothetical protein